MKLKPWGSQCEGHPEYNVCIYLCSLHRRLKLSARANEWIVTLPHWAVTKYKGWSHITVCPIAAGINIRKTFAQHQ